MRVRAQVVKVVQKIQCFAILQFARNEKESRKKSKEQMSQQQPTLYNYELYIRIYLLVDVLVDRAFPKSLRDLQSFRVGAPRNLLVTLRSQN